MISAAVKIDIGQMIADCRDGYSLEQLLAREISSAPKFVCKEGWPGAGSIE